MKTIELRRRIPLRPAQILDQMADAGSWASDGTSVTIHQGAAAGVRLTARSPIPASDLPPAAARFVGSGPELVQHVQADPVTPEAQSATLQIAAEVVGAPVDIDITIGLQQAGDATEAHALARITADLPLVGPLIESALEPRVTSLLAERLDKLADL